MLFSRVCKRWKAIAYSTDLIYTDKDTFFGSRSSKLRSILSRIRNSLQKGKASKSFIFTSPNVRKFVFNGQFSAFSLRESIHRAKPLAHESNTAGYVACLATRFAQLESISLVRAMFLWIPEFSYWKTSLLIDALPNVNISLTNCYVMVLPREASWKMYQDNAQNPPGITGSWCVPVTGLVVSDEVSIRGFREQFANMTWPYPAGQVAWLAEHASRVHADRPIWKWLDHTRPWELTRLDLPYYGAR